MKIFAVLTAGGIIILGLLAVIAFADLSFQRGNGSALEQSADAILTDMPATSLETCEAFDAEELQDHLPHEAALDTHFNRAVHDATVSGLASENVVSSVIGQVPQHVLGYADKTSYNQAEMAQISFAKGLIGDGKFLTSAVIYDAALNTEVKRFDLSASDHPLQLEPCHSFREDGCRFSQSFSIPMIDLSPGGYYVFLFDDMSSQSHAIFFSVRPRDEDLKGYDTFVILADTTWHAYNFFAGGSLYLIYGESENGLQINQNRNTYLYSVAFDRPNANLMKFSRQNQTLVSPDLLQTWDASRADTEQPPFTPQDGLDLCIQTFADADRKKLNNCYYQTRPTPMTNMVFSKKLIENGKRHAILSMIDLERLASEALPANSTLLFTGHNEYWTLDMEQAVSKFIERGGSILNMSGNLNWWRINIEGNTLYQDQGQSYRTSLCTDAIPAQYRDLGTLGFSVFPATESLFGVSYRYAGLSISYVLDAEIPLKPLEVADNAKKFENEMTILQPEHPIFAGLQVSNAAGSNKLAIHPLMMADEVDGMPLLNDRLNPNYRFDASPRTTPLAKMGTFAVNHVNGENGAVFKNLVEPAVVVETRPHSTPESGNVISIGAIGLAYALLFDDPIAERLLLNGLEFLD